MIWPEKVIDFAESRCASRFSCVLGFPIWAVRGSFDGEIRCRGENDEPAARRSSGRPFSPPTEIEGALRAIDGVSDAAVIGRENAIGEKQLIAYYVPTASAAITVTKIRNDLARVIPDFMIPDVFVRINAIPHTPNGKIDRINLPAPSRERPTLDVPFAAPVTNIEKELAKIWCQVLHLDCIGVRDNFLDLGGNSLRMAQVVNRVRDAFEVELPLRALFEHPTVS
jgi:hypothetical protein